MDFWALTRNELIRVKSQTFIDLPRNLLRNNPHLNFSAIQAQDHGLIF